MSAVLAIDGKLYPDVDEAYAALHDVPLVEWGDRLSWWEARPALRCATCGVPFVAPKSGKLPNECKTCRDR